MLCMLGLAVWQLGHDHSAFNKGITPVPIGATNMTEGDPLPPEAV